MAAAEALADVIVGVAGDLDGDALAHERAQGLARAPSSLMSMVPSGSPSPAYFFVTSCESMQPTVRSTLDTAPAYHLLAPLNRRLGNLDERLIEGQFQAVVLR